MYNLRTGRVAFVATLLLTVALAAPTFAQLDDDASSAIQFNFNPPGARSLGLGGAFLAVADDATAAFTNPAGLVILREREVFAEVRQTNSSIPYVDNGVGTIAPDGRSVLPTGTATGTGVNTIDNLQFGETDDESTGLSFVSYVQPIGDFRIALYRHELVNFETEFQTGGAFLNVPAGTLVTPTQRLIADVPTSRLFPVQASVEVDIENIGVSFAYKFSETFSLGLGVSFYEFDVNGRTNRFSFPPTSIDAAPNYSLDNVATAQTQTGDDDDIGINLGFLWSPNSKFSLGGAYREGGEFEYNYAVNDNLATPTFNVPTVYGIGIAVRPTVAFTISLDVNEVEYSALVDNFTTLLDGNRPDLFVVEDATEVHLGFEYRFLNMANPITLRAGVWEDPVHQIRRNPNGFAPPVTGPLGTRDASGDFEFTQDNQDGLVELSQQQLWAAAETADDEIHYAVGIGFTLGENFSLDLAGDFSERVDIAAISAVVRF
ncbi:MAG: outer membrane protein transport protein [Acidobacteriota bacterium]